MVEESIANEPRQLLARLNELLERDDDTQFAAGLENVRAADLAEVFGMLREEDRSRMLFALPARTAAEVVNELEAAVLNDVVDDLETPHLTEILAAMTPDDAADVLEDLPDDEMSQILDAMPDEKSEPIRELLAFDPYSAGGIMTTDVVSLPESATVRDAVRHVRNAAQDEDLHEIYITDTALRLLGAVPLRKLVTTPKETVLRSLVDPDVIKVHSSEDQESVLNQIRKYDASAAAVVDDNGVLLGRITYDDFLDVAREEAEEDMLRLAGTDPAEFDTKSVIRASRIRLFWLMPCMVGMLGSAAVLGLGKPHFELDLFALLVLFVPMIGATGGNSGIQISTVIVRAFASGDAAASRLGHAIYREGRIVLIMAPVLGFVAWLAVRLLLPLIERFEGHAGSHAYEAQAALAVGLAMVSAILTSGGLGIALPFTFRRLNVDPAIASGPLVTTLNDIMSVTIYLIISLGLS